MDDPPSVEDISFNSEALYSYLRDEAVKSPICQNRMLSSEYVSYCLSWNHEISESVPIREVIYGAYGADIATAALIFNADQITGYDIVSLDMRKIEQALEHWDIVDQDTPLYPDLPRTMRRNPSYFSDSIDYRYNHGFWNTDEVIHIIGLERLVIMDLKCMGVDPNTIKLTCNGKIPEIIFRWKHPLASEDKEIHLLLVNKSVSKVAKRKEIPAYYEKARTWNERSIFSFGMGYLHGIAKRITSGGIILFGMPALQKGRSSVWVPSVDSITAAFSDGFRQKCIPDVAQDKLIGQPGSYYERSTYGWKLLGFKKD